MSTVSAATIDTARFAVGGATLPLVASAVAAAFQGNSSGRGESILFEFRADLAPGTVLLPKRAIGDIGAELPAAYPTRWPPAVEAVLKARGSEPVRLYCDGIFDATHFGHFRALEQAKRAFPNVYLMAGCCNDALTHKYKGETVLTELERYESLRAVKWVDKVIPDAPWVVTADFIALHDIDFVCHDALPYADASGAGTDCYAPLRAMGKFHETQRTDGISTSDLIIRIVRRYDDFVRRNLSRGYTAKDMNVPYWKGKSLELGLALEKGAASAATRVAALSDAAETLHYGFVRLFAPSGPVQKTLRGVRDDVMGGLHSLGSLIGLSSSGGGKASFSGSSEGGRSRSHSTASAASAGCETASEQLVLGADDAAPAEGEAAPGIEVPHAARSGENGAAASSSCAFGARRRRRSRPSPRGAAASSVGSGEAAAAAAAAASEGDPEEGFLPVLLGKRGRADVSEAQPSEEESASSKVRRTSHRSASRSSPASRS